MSENARKERHAKPSDQSRLLPLRSRGDIQQVEPGAQSRQNQLKFLFIDKDDYDTGPTQHSMDKLHRLRQKIKEGQMERVVPGTVSARETAGPAPPRPAHNPYHSPVTSRPESKGSEKTKSITSMWAESFKSVAGKLTEAFEPGGPGRAGANTRAKDSEAGLDRRRGLPAKIRAPYENLCFPGLSARRRGSYNSLNSVDTFFCQGESAADLQASQHVQENIKQEKNPSTGSWGREHAESQIHLVSAHCKLCRKPGAQGLHDLCYACEDEFVRRQTQIKASEARKPIPPPKDQNRLPVESLTREQSQGQHIADQIRKDIDLPPEGESWGEMRFGDVRRKPVFHSPDLRRPRSQRALIGDINSEYEEWAEEEHVLSPATFQGFDGEQAIQQELQWKSAARTSRTTGFYGFWDEVLSDDEDGRPKKVR